jgi:O-antigen/teichoic acid export membrane protein
MDSTVKPALTLMSGRSLAMMATFLLPVVLVRVFDQAGFGTYKQLFLVYATVFQVGVVLAESLFYFLPRAAGRSGRYVANAVLALAAAGLAGLALLWIAAPDIARWLGNPPLARYLPLLGVFVALMLPSAGLEIVMVARKRYRGASGAYATSDVLRALALLAPALIWRRLDLLFAGAIAFAFGRLCATLLYFRREFSGTFRPAATLYAEQVAYVWPFALAVVVETLQVNYHHYAVAHRFDAATFAVYAVGCFSLPLLELIAGPMGNVMMVRMTEKIRDGQGKDALEIWAGTCRALALVFLPVMAFLLVGAHDLIVFLFTDGYRASVPIFMIWSLSVAHSVFPTDGALRVYAATRFLLAVSALRLLAVSTLIGGAISLLGLPGAVLVTIAVAVMAKAAALVHISRLMQTSLTRLLPWRDLAAVAAGAAVAAVPALLVTSTLSAPAFARLAVTGLVYAVTYVAILFHSGLLTEAEKRALVSRVPRWPLTAPASEHGS